MSTEHDREDWTFDTLRSEADELRSRINRFRIALSRFFVGKQPIIDLLVVSAIAQEPLLLVGPPGTAKSELIVKFIQALGLTDDDYFEYMLTRFTEPSEILGPIDLAELRSGRYLRQTTGMLPTARVAFLDEIFKANSAILNVLLTIINERKFYQDGRPHSVPLRMLFAATNEIPEQGDLLALQDRFALKVLSPSVQDSHFVELINQGMQHELDRQQQRQPWREGLCSFTDLLKAGRYLTGLWASFVEQSPPGEQPLAADPFFPRDVFHDFQRLVRSLTQAEGIAISDRRVVKLYKLIRAHAWLLRGGTVTRDDLQLVAHAGNTLDELLHLEQRVPQLLG